MAHEGSIYGQPTTPPSMHDEHSLNEFAANSVPVQLYTPPHSRLAQAYGYGDPEEYQMGHNAEYYEPAYYRTPPMPINAGRMQTRSGRSAGSPMTPATSSPSSRTSRSSRPKKRKDRKQTDNLMIVEPLSLMTKEYEEPVMDMMAWANRSNDERYNEVKGKHKGKVPRPMNSFMLYRTAYKERIKRWGAQGDNNQLISRVAGLSWPLESDELKEFYAKCANVEKENHQAAFPNYKFAPNKHPRKRDRENDDDEESDAEWDGGSSYSNKRRRARVDRDMTRSRSTTPARISQYQEPAYHSSPFMTSSPDPRALAHMQGYYDQFGGHLMAPNHYYHMAVPTYPNHPQDFQYGPTSAPVQRDPYATQLVGIPSGPGDDMGSFYPSDHPEPMIDPNLHHFQAPTEYQYGSALDGRQHEPIAEATMGFEEHTEAMAHPGMQMLAGAEPMWSPGGSLRNEFDAELDRWHKGQWR